MDAGLDGSSCDLTSKFLTAWGFTSLVSVFREQEIDLDAFLALTPEYIKELVPLLGVRMKLMAKIQALKDSSEPVPNAIVKLITDTDSVEFERTVCSGGDKTPNQNEIDPIPGTSSKTLFLEINEANASPESTNQVEKVKRPADSTDARESNKRSKLNENLEELPDKWQALLESCPKGLGVLRVYETDHSLSRNCRNQLVDLVINHEMRRIIKQGKTDEVPKIPHSRLAELAAEIETQFPNEKKEIYYIQSKKVDGKKVSARGKLVDKYWNFRRFAIGPKTPSSESAVGPIVVSPEMQDKVLWLTNNLAPWSKVEEYWRDTADVRANDLNAKQSDKVVDYMKKYPALRQPLGYILLEQDFERLYEDKSLNLFSSAPTLVPKILKAASEKKAKPDSAIYKLLREIPEDCEDNDAKSTLALLVLPHLFKPVVAIRSSTAGTWKPSMKEIADGFLLHLKTSQEVRPALKTRDEKLKRLGLTAQPLAIIVGQDPLHVDEAIVVIDSHLYMCDTVLKAIDVCFKATFALDACYAPEAQQVWTFLQKCVYKIDLKSDGRFVSVSELRAQLNL